MWSAIRFELKELLGEGSQGRVYKALRRDRSSGLTQTVAVKILHSKTAVELWRQEFESLARVNSPFCVRVLSFERLKRQPALVLEYVDGVTLAQLGQTCWLSEDDVREIVAQLECAIRELHAQGVFHGDLSPQNVMLDVSGRVKIFDFGLANCGEQTRLTPKFAAPERMRGARASAAADIFSLGKVKDFLLGFENPDSPYLREAPEERRLLNLTPDFRLQERLAVKVGALLAKIRAAGALTTAVRTPARQKPSLKKELVLAAITALLALALPGASPQASRPELALLKIRTRHWHRFFLNGRPLGYSPITTAIPAGKPARLDWESAGGEGNLSLQLRPFEVRTLDDSDFSH